MKVNTQKMKVNILKSEKNYMISSSYNQKLLKLIRNIKKRYWCTVSKVWYLPLDSFEQLKDDLKKDPFFEVHINELKTYATFKTVDDENIEITFSRFTDKFREFMELSEQRYIQGSGKLILPARFMEKAIKLCETFNFEVVIIKNN